MCVCVCSRKFWGKEIGYWIVIKKRRCVLGEGGREGKGVRIFIRLINC